MIGIRRGLTMFDMILYEYPLCIEQSFQTVLKWVGVINNFESGLI